MRSLAKNTALRTLCAMLVLCISVVQAPAEDTQASSIVECIQAIQPLDSETRDILFTGCLTAVEHRCLRNYPLTEDGSCFNQQTGLLSDYNAEILARLPLTPPTHLGRFSKRLYERTMESLKNPTTRKNTINLDCEIMPHTCDFLRTVFETKDILLLAKYAKVALPEQPDLSKR